MKNRLKSSQDERGIARIARLPVTGESMAYHVMSRTALDGFPLGDAEKDFLVSLIRKKSLQ